MSANKPFVNISTSSSPEIETNEVYLPGGPSKFGSGWMVTKFVANILETHMVVASIAVHEPQFQISATLDTSKIDPRVFVSLFKSGKQISGKIVEITNWSNADPDLTVYWNDWIIGEIEWSSKRLSELKAV